jgi:hypothetical protein
MCTREAEQRVKKRVEERNSCEHTVIDRLNCSEWKTPGAFGRLNTGARKMSLRKISEKSPGYLSLLPYLW